ncbi:MAG TPA: nitroreductase [Sphingomonadaceae bacterium]|jgi:nitroreductase|nr:nitroreductase [Sphingomonadaceae bacterium]
MLNDRTTLLTHLRTRRSGRPRDMVEPGPDEAQIAEIIEIAARVPDHGKLFPWRFVVVPKARRDDFARLLKEAFEGDAPTTEERKLEAVERIARQAPALIVVMSAPVAGHKVPVWEQELSAGAACMNLLHAVHAMGFVGGWISGWPAYSETVRNAFGASHERIAGLMFIGTPAFPLEERPRAAASMVSTVWSGLPPA